MTHSAHRAKLITYHHKEMQDSLLSITAHELKTPLTTIKLMIKFLFDCIQKGGKNCLRLVNLGTITRELERMTDLINDMVRFRGADNIMSQPDLAIVNLGSLIHEVVENKSFESNTHKMLFSTTSSIQVLADENRIKQVLINLLTNAIRYSPKGSIISIKVQRQKKFAIVSVSDQGKGIPKEDIIAVFDKYYRVPNQKEKGQGLGLYIVKEIIRSHQGKIWITSQVGKGSTFYFTLPLPKKEIAERSSR